MSQPRMRFAGETVHVTRTTIGRQFLLKPDPVVNQILLYCLFRAASQHGVLVHSLVAVSNHVHMVLTDVRGELSECMHKFVMLSAKCLIAHYGKLYPEQYLAEIWSKDPYNATVLPNAEAVIDALRYDVTNPVKDGLVADHRDWPGVCSRPDDWRRPGNLVERPKGLAFSDRTKELREVTAQFVVPPVLADRPLEQAIDAVQHLISDTLKSTWAEFARTERTFLGAKAVLRTSPFAAPNKPRDKGKRVPAFAAGGDSALLNACLTTLRQFRQKYRECWRALMGGDKAVVFPAGTYLLRKRFGVCCDDWSPPWCCTA